MAYTVRPVADSGEGPWPRFFLDQTEARRAKKIFGGRFPPLCQGLNDRPPPPPPPLSEGLDPPLEAPPSKGTFFRLQRVGVSLAEVYEREGKTVTSDCKNP